MLISECPLTEATENTRPSLYPPTSCINVCLMLDLYFCDYEPYVFCADASHMCQTYSTVLDCA